MKETLLTLPSPFGDALTVCKYSWGKASAPDNVLSIVSGLHGDQVNGLYINSLLARYLHSVVEGREPGVQLKGRVQILPVANMQALRSGDRLWSFDGLDFDLAFPGNEKGEVSERVTREILTHTADSTHCIVLKTANPLYEDAPHMQLAGPDRPTKKMARGLGLDVARKLPDATTFQLSLFSHWRESDIPSLTVSAGRAKTLDRSLCDSLYTNLVNLMTHTGVLASTGKKKNDAKLRIFPAHADHLVLASQAGLFVADVRVGEFLKQGQKIGEMRSIGTGETLEEYSAPLDGYLVTLRHHPVTFERESIATLLTDTKQGFWPF